MRAEDILTLDNIGEVLTLLEQNISPLSDGDIWESIKFYRNDHPILHDEELKDKWEDEIEKDPKTGKDKKVRHLKRRTRQALPYQQQIITTASAWIMGKGINLIFNSDNQKDISSYDTFVKVWKDSNIITLLRKVSKITGIETRSVIQFFYDNESDKIKGKILSFGDGYNIYRHKDENGKMDAVVVHYLRDKIENGILTQNVDTTEIYLKDKWYRYEGLELLDGYPKSNPKGIDKLLFAYFEQEYPEYWFVREIINKQDYSRSQHSDVNTRIGNPALVVHGKILTKPLISDAVKIYEIQSAGSSMDTTSSGGADMKYLEVTSAPESVKLEMENNERDIYRFTYPDLYALIEKSISGNLSSKSITLMFTHVFAKVAEKQAIWDDMIRRCISILKDMASVIYADENIKNLNIGFKYNSLLPSSVDDDVTMFATATGAKLTTPSRAASQLDFNDPETVKFIKDMYDESVKESQVVAPSINQNAPNPDGTNGK